jgi:hypothetical protein
MARYIDADKVNVKDIYSVHGECYITDVKEWLDEQPTADVVPRAELAVRSFQDAATIDALKTELCAIRGAANSLKMYYENGKTEVAREIFEEIEASIATHAFTSKSEDYADGMFDAIEWVDSKIAELKKKYTEVE